MFRTEKPWLAVYERGKVEPESFRVLLASDPGLMGETRMLVLASRFDPAERQGARVRQVVRQVIQWERR